MKTITVSQKLEGRLLVGLVCKRIDGSKYTSRLFLPELVHAIVPYTPLTGPQCLKVITGSRQFYYLDHDDEVEIA